MHKGPQVGPSDAFSSVLTGRTTYTGAVTHRCHDLLFHPTKYDLPRTVLHLTVRREHFVVSFETPEASGEKFARRGKSIESAIEYTHSTYESLAALYASVDDASYIAISFGEVTHVGGRSPRNI